MSRFEKKTGLFIAIDSEGKPVQITIFTEVIQKNTSKGIIEIEGMKILRLSDGSVVNRKAKGLYEVGSIKGDLTSHDPNAP